MPETNIPETLADVSVTENQTENSNRVLCSCNKLISKKNMSTHLKTKIHCNKSPESAPESVKLEEPKTDEPISAPVESKPDDSPKKKSVENAKRCFENLEKKLDVLLELTNEIYCILNEDDDEEVTN